MPEIAALAAEPEGPVTALGPRVLHGPKHHRDGRALPRLRSGRAEERPIARTPRTLRPWALRSSAGDRLIVAGIASALLWLIGAWAMDWL